MLQSLNAWSKWERVALRSFVRTFSVKVSSSQAIIVIKGSTHFHELFKVLQPSKILEQWRTKVTLRSNTHECAINQDSSFMFKVEPGTASNSFGILCAKEGGFPEEVARRAAAITSCLLDGTVSRFHASSMKSTCQLTDIR